MGLPASTGIADQIKPSWPWDWNGKEPVVPSIDGEETGAAKNEPVYRFRVRGTEDLELIYEIVRPDGETDTLPVTLRRAIGLVRLSGDDRNDRDDRSSASLDDRSGRDDPSSASLDDRSGRDDPSSASLDDRNDRDDPSSASLDDSAPRLGPCTAPSEVHTLLLRPSVRGNLRRRVSAHALLPL